MHIYQLTGNWGAKTYLLCEKLHTQGTSAKNITVRTYRVDILKRVLFTLKQLLKLFSYTQLETFLFHLVTINPFNPKSFPAITVHEFPSLGLPNTQTICLFQFYFGHSNDQGETSVSEFAYVLQLDSVTEDPGCFDLYKKFLYFLCFSSWGLCFGSLGVWSFPVQHHFLLFVRHPCRRPTKIKQFL